MGPPGMPIKGKLGIDHVEHAVYGTAKVRIHGGEVFSDPDLYVTHLWLLRGV